MARTSSAVVLASATLLAACGSPRAAVIFDGQFITVGGKRVEMGRPIEEWEAILGKGERDLYGILWRQYRFVGYTDMNVCGRYYVTGGLVNLSDDPEITVAPPLGAAVQLEDCLLTKDTKLSGGSLNCSRFSDFGTIVLERGHPFAFAYSQPGGQLERMVMVTKEDAPSQVSQSLATEVAKELGMDLGHDTPEGKAYRASGACDRPPPKLIYGWARFWRDIRRAWTVSRQGWKEKHGR